MEEDFTLLVKYLDGDLSAAETAVVKNRLQAETALQQLLAEAQLLQGGIRSHARRADFANMAEWDREAASVVQPRRLAAVWKYVLPLAATVALLIGGWWWYQTSQPSAEMQLAMTYFEPLPPLQNTRSGADELAILRGQAYSFYVPEDYAAAIPLFKQAKTEYGDSLSVFYLGVSYLGNQQPQRAVEELELFETYLADFQILRERTIWYLGLAYVASGEVEKGRAKLLEIKDSATFGDNILEIFNGLERTEG